MIYQGLERLQHVCFFVTAREAEGAIETPCGVTVSPIAPAEVIVYGPDGVRVVYDAAYGSLPNSNLVVMVKDPDEVFPTQDPEITLKVVLEKYAEDDPNEVLKGVFKPFDPNDCPICGCHTEDGDDDDDDEDDDDGDPEKEPEPQAGPENRIKPYLPSHN